MYNILTMKIQQFNPKMISITQLRRNIDVLEEVLTSEREAWVMRHQSVFFVALKPERFQQLQAPKTPFFSIDQAIRKITQIRNEFGKKKKSTSDYVIKMRDERVGKWRK